MKIALKIVLLLVSTLSLSQNKSENEVFKKIIDHEIKKNKTKIYIGWRKPKTSFEINEFKAETIGLTISEITLKEFETNNINTNEVWNSELLNQIELSSNYVASTNCLTEEETEVLFKNTKKRQNILLISKPIFDNNFENCIVSIIYSRSYQSAFGKSYFLKKVNGIWTITLEFQYWMS